MAASDSCRFPDWLGYLGLGLFHTESTETIDRTLTKAWIPQFLRLLCDGVESRGSLQSILDSPVGVLRWQDLDRLESGLSGS